MSFKRLDQEDIVISADSITAPAWSDNQTTLTEFYTSSAQVSRNSGDYYYDTYQTGSGLTGAAIQFSLAYGHVAGSGSLPFNPGVAGASPSQVVYKQFRNLVNGTEETNLGFAGTTVESIYAVSIERARFKEKLLPGSLLLTLSSSAGDIKLTDDSNYVTTVTYGDSGREFNLVSASSAGVRFTGNGTDGVYGYNTASGSFGKFLPDIGTILLNGDALDLAPANGGITLGTATGVGTNSANITKIYNAINDGGNFVLRSEETVSSNYIFVRARNSEFNYSTNPSNITGSGELRHSAMIDSPQAYVTSVGLYNDNNDLLGIAKLSRPLLKDFTKESLIRVKLDY